MKKLYKTGKRLEPGIADVLIGIVAILLAALLPHPADPKGDNKIYTKNA
jgi:hypothetical protein